MPTARQEIATAVLDGKVYVIGGYDAGTNPTSRVDVYNPNTDTWAGARAIPFTNHHQGAAVAAGKLYTFGGVSSRTLVYDAQDNSWSDVAGMKQLHGLSPAVGVHGGKIYVAGGALGFDSLKELEVYDPAANTWTILAPMSVARNHTGGAFINGKFYVVGGRGSASAATALEVYDPQANSWSSRPPMPSGRSGIGVAAVNGELYVFGGEGGGIHDEVEVYNPATNSWRQLPPMPTPRHGLWASVIGDRTYLPGGATAEDFNATNVNEVFLVDRKATFANISSRLRVGTGDDVLIGGFIVTGSASKRIILRAPGPSVPVNGALADPMLELYNDAKQLVASNNNWPDAPNMQEIFDSALAPAQNAEPAILKTVAPGNYTVVVRGASNSTGVALVEVYDLEAGSESKLANISTRGFVQTGDNVLIGGFILTGTEPRRAIIRAIGPSLPVPGALTNPKLDLRDANGALLASNDNWRTTQEAEIVGTTLAPSDDRESAIVRDLPPSNYTAIVSGVGETTGVALVEAYSLE